MLILLVTPIVIITTMGFIASAFTPTLATKHPLLMIALDARNRFLVLARNVDLVPFVIVAVLRRSFSDPLFYLLGRFYGENALRWLQKKGGAGDLVPFTEKLFKKAGYPMVFAFPGAIVCALAGQTGHVAGRVHDRQPVRHADLGLRWCAGSAPPSPARSRACSTSSAATSSPPPR